MPLDNHLEPAFSGTGEERMKRKGRKKKGSCLSGLACVGGKGAKGKQESSFLFPGKSLRNKKKAQAFRSKEWLIIFLCARSNRKKEMERGECSVETWIIRVRSYSRKTRGEGKKGNHFRKRREREGVLDNGQLIAKIQFPVESRRHRKKEEKKERGEREKEILNPCFPPSAQIVERGRGRGYCLGEKKEGKRVFAYPPLCSTKGKRGGKS